jgi:hypothetical protein
VDHALPHPSGPTHSHPWRTIAVVAGGIALLELLVLAIVGIAVLAKPMAHREAVRQANASVAVTPKKHSTAPSRPLLPRRRVSVTVLNANGISGAAASEASRARTRGYKIGVVGNAPRGGFGTTIVMYRSGFAPEGSRLAHDLGIGRAAPLDGLRPRDLRGAKLAIVLGG